MLTDSVVQPLIMVPVATSIVFFVLNFVAEALAMHKILARDFAVNSAHLEMRIGIGTGPLVAGIVGINKFIYDLWGDTANLASRITSESSPGMIQCDTATYHRLAEHFDFQSPKNFYLKGKSDVPVYQLIGRRTSA
jgi:class 3 adenylate cyclase